MDPIDGQKTLWHVTPLLLTGSCDCCTPLPRHPHPPTPTPFLYMSGMSLTNHGPL